eukprot:gene12318-15485_t
MDMGMALHSLPSSLRQTLVILDLGFGGELDGTAFLALVDCPSLTTLKIQDSKITSIEAMDSITCLTQVQPPGDRVAVLRLLPQLQDLSLDDCALQDSDVEALAGLSALTRLEFAGPMELTRPHRLPILKHVCLSGRQNLLIYRISAGVPLRQLDWLMGGSTSLREIAYTAWHKQYEPTMCPDSMRLFISTMRNNPRDLITALRSVSLALQQCRMKELHVEYTFYGAGGRLRLEPEMIEALAPLNETLK